MASFITNRGAIRLFELANRNLYNGSAFTNFYVGLVTTSSSPTVDTNILSDVTEIAAGNGYSTGGTQVNRDATDWDTLTEDDVNDLGKILLKDISFAASGGAIPVSGSAVRYAVLLGPHATPSSREVVACWDLGSNITLPEGARLVLADFELRGTN